MAAPRPQPKRDAYADFMAHAYTIELEATDRYAQFAEQLETHNNGEVARLFRKLSEIEGLHARHILSEMGWASLPVLPAAYACEGADGPETAPFEALHYLMQPYQALEIALRCELQAVKYFEDIAAGKAPSRVRQAAAAMAEEEREHVSLIRDWMKKESPPQPGWDEDPDPPRLGD
jgi:rubrerythrin